MPTKTRARAARKPAAAPQLRRGPPGPRSEQMVRLKERYVSNGIRLTFPVAFTNGTGAYLTDVDGNRFIDFSGGIGVHNVGHRPKEVVTAVRKQLDQLTHICFMVAMYDPYVQLAKRMAEICPAGLTKSMFVNSGSEAIENAVKIARAATKRKYLVSFRSAFHGRTLLTISLTGKMKPYKEGFGPFVPEILHADYAYCYRCPLQLTFPSCGLACVDEIARAMDQPPYAGDIAALVAEPVQGEGGFIVPPPGYFQKLVEVVQSRGGLFIDDEVQAGMGRTGRLWAIEHWGVSPDLLVSGKALGGGLPIGGVTGRPEAMDAPGPASLGGTFGGNPLSCAAALRSIALIRRALPKAKPLGTALEKRLAEWAGQFELIGDVRGLGPMRAMEFVRDRASKTPAPEVARAVQLDCFKHGLIILTAGYYSNCIRLLPPLTVSRETLEAGLGVLEESLRTVQASPPPPS